MRYSYFSNLFGILIGVNLIQLLVTIATATVTHSLFWQLTTLLLMFVYIYLWVLLIKKANEEDRRLFLFASLAYWVILGGLVFFTRSGMLSLMMGTIHIFLLGLPFSPLYFPEGFTAFYMLCTGMSIFTLFHWLCLVKRRWREKKYNLQ